MLSRKCLLLVLALTVLATAPAWAEAKLDVLEGPLGFVDLESSATWDGSAFVYTYVMYNRSTNAGDIHVFGIDNPEGSPYTDADNNAGFSNPGFNAYLPTEVLTWLNGQIGLGGSGTFTYRSINAPRRVPVEAICINEGKAASGYTMGMSAPIPEPGCLMSLAGGLLAMSGVCYRKARRK